MKKFRFTEEQMVAIVGRDTKGNVSDRHGGYDFPIEEVSCRRWPFIFDTSRAARWRAC